MVASSDDAGKIRVVVMPTGSIAVVATVHGHNIHKRERANTRIIRTADLALRVHNY
jgi:hypothetical protein